MKLLKLLSNFEPGIPITNASSNNLSPGLSQALYSSSKASSHSVSDSTDDDEHAIAPSSSSSSPSRSRKKPRRTDETDQRLQRLEDLEIKRRKIQHHSTSLSDLDSSSSSEEAEDGAVSTPEAAIHGEEPKFDLMKSMLRKNYTQLNYTKSKLEEENTKVKVATNKLKNKKIDMTGEGGTATGVKRKEGPKFRNLGGMEQVLEELKNDVLLPLYDPHLSDWLGDEPMAGILLYGPPGCGKTTLAHAIANETGVPF